MSLRSSDSECDTVRSVACEALNCASLLRVFGYPSTTTALSTGSSAAKAAAERPSGGKMKHAESRHLFYNCVRRPIV